MNSSLTTGMVVLFASLVGASASIATAWMTQHYQRIREHGRAELRRRESLYGEFITETARLTADAFEHSLARPETLSTLYAILGRVRLVASEPVFKAAEECCNYVIDMYSKPNMTIEQVYELIRTTKHPLKTFAAACRVELNQYVV